MPIESCLYECRVAHRRFIPKSYAFDHGHFMWYIALEELGDLRSEVRLFSSNASTPYSFDQSDYLPDGCGEQSLCERVLRICKENGIEVTIDKIRLLTNVRFLGYVFNPVSLFFCFDETNRPICCICEVGNTFGEKKPYLVKVSEEGKFHARHQKLFYVSPYAELEDDFVFDLSVPEGSLNVRINTMRNAKTIIHGNVFGKRVPLTDLNLLTLSLRYPWAPLRVIVLIHWHAFALWLRRLNVHRKEDKKHLQLGLTRPKRMKKGVL